MRRIGSSRGSSSSKIAARSHYRVVQPSGVRGRLEAVAAARGLTPSIGREAELSLLLNRWERVLDGEGQVALIIGEAGIGKSRLVHRFQRTNRGDAAHVGRGRDRAFFPEHTLPPGCRDVARTCSVVWRRVGRGELAQLASRLRSAGLKPAEAIPLIAPLMNLPLPAKYPPSALSSEQQRRRLLATLVEWVLAAARVQPLVIATEDLHWADPSTLELIQLFVEQGRTARLLLLYTARAEFHPQWPLRAHHAHLVLDLLSDRQAREMVENIGSQKELSADMVETVLRRATGVPLFVEELTRDLLERGERPMQHQIPATLHDSLMARLDRLGSARELAQIGAAIGREFSYELLHTVASVSERELRVALDSLVGAELLYARGSPPEANYVFKHALVQDAAYNTLLKSRRRELHQRIAHTLEEGFPDCHVGT